DTQIGRPLVEGARVLADVLDFPSTKLYIQHFRRRKNYRRLRGHRQYYIEVEIRHILLKGQEPPPEEEETPEEEGQQEEEQAEDETEGEEEEEGGEEEKA